jgi:hypothetical protein
LSCALALAACSNGARGTATGSGGSGASDMAGGSNTGGSNLGGNSTGDSGGSDGGASTSGSGGSMCLSSNGGGPSAGSGGAGGGEFECHGSGARFVTQVVEVCFGADAGFGQDHFPKIVYGPPKGGGAGEGSLDVLSLGEGGEIIVAFHDNAIVDGPGPDFIVFENPFEISGDPNDIYANPGTVSVSDDGVTWTAFPCAAKHAPWGQCAGWHPVFANAGMNEINPLDPATAGGDAFDLADIGVTRARFVKITDRADLPGDFDLDAVGIVNAACP